MTTYIIVASFKPNTNMQEVFAVAKEEQAQVAALRSAGRLGAVHLSMARGTVFLEIIAPDETQAAAVVASLPMARWWNLDSYPTVEPTQPRQE